MAVYNIFAVLVMPLWAQQPPLPVLKKSTPASSGK